MEGVIANADKLKGKLKERVMENVELARLSRELATINCHVELKEAIDDFIVKEPNAEAALPLFSELEINKMSKRFLGEGIEAEQAETLKTLADVEHNYVIVESDADINRLIGKLEAAESFCFDLETTSKEATEAQLVGLGFGFEVGTAYYVPYPDDLMAFMILDRFKPIFESPKSTKIGQNLKYDISVLRNYSIKVEGPLWDTMLAHYVIEPEAGHGMDELAGVYLSYKPISFSSITDGDDLFASTVETAVMGEYCCEDVDVTLRLKEAFEPLLKERNAERVFKLECSLIPILVDMQQTGIRFDADSLTEFAKDLKTELTELQNSIWEEAGETFNINSGKQLGIILFEKLKLEEKPKKTKTGQYKTDEQVLMRLANKHAIVKMISRYKSLEKLNNTYVLKLPAFAAKADSRIRTHFNQAVTSTGRIASDKPNLQNIPIRTSDGKELRKAFVSSGPGFVLLSADYSQIELRIIAEFSKSSHLLNAFKSDEDVHETTAALVFGVPREEVTSDMRGKAKMVNYGIAYGLSAFGLSQRLNIPRGEAAAVINQYFTAFPEIKDYIEATKEFAKENGYVETLIGRRRYLPDVNSKNGTVRQAAERNAVNMPVQGTSADMIKIAMVKVAEDMAKAKLKSKMLLQIHDELLFDAHVDEIDQLKEIVVQGMVNAIEMGVPVEVNVGIGDNWLEAH
jgi:DNA polymerase-1